MVIEKGHVIKSVIFSIVFIVSGLLSLIIIYSDDLSENLTYNLKKNLNVDWGDDHPKFINQGLNVDLLDLSVSWDHFNIIFPNTETEIILNAISNIQSIGCISKLSLSLNFKINIICSEIIINLKNIKWTKYDNLNISRTFFFEHRVFDDFYEKQSNYLVNIDTTNLVINKTNLGHSLIEYSFLDKENMQLMIDGKVIILTKKYEGLYIHSVGSDYFFFNQNYFDNTRMCFQKKTCDFLRHTCQSKFSHRFSPSSCCISHTHHTLKPIGNETVKYGCLFYKPFEWCDYVLVCESSLLPKH